jgi:hypothetical protein
MQEGRTGEQTNGSRTPRSPFSRIQKYIFIGFKNPKRSLYVLNDDATIV